MIFLTEIGNTIRKASSQYWDTISVSIRVNGSLIVEKVPGRLSNGYYYFAGVEEIVRAYMEKNNLTICTVGGTYYEVDSDSSQSATENVTDARVVYRSVLMRAYPMFSADALLSSMFLTPHKSAVLFNGGILYLSYYNTTANVSYTLTCTKRSDGTTDVLTYSAASTGLSSISVSYISTYSKIVVAMGDRSFTVYMVDMIPGEEFKFRNAFNIEESINLPASTEEAPKTEFEEAEQGRVRTRYDIEHDIEFTVKTGSLPAIMYSSILDMVRARVITRKYQFVSGTTTYTSYLPVVVKDYKLPKSNDPSKPISLEMKFVYADKSCNDAVVIE